MLKLVADDVPSIEEFMKKYKVRWQEEILLPRVGGQKISWLD